MIKIEFEQKSKEEVLIFGIDECGDKKEIGRIFTPAGSGEDSINAIQICGFDHAYDFWGCGVYGDKATGKMKKDIQLLWFGLYDKMTTEEMAKVRVAEKEHDVMKDRFSIDGKGACMRCFNYPCTCEIKIDYENPYTVKRSQDVRPSTLEEYNESVKRSILRGLGDEQEELKDKMKPRLKIKKIK